MSFIPNQLAVVEHIHQSKSPILLAGEIDPAVMRTFELGCLDFFDCKEIKEGDQVRKILGCFRDTRIRDWINGDRNRLLTLSFADFMTELRANYLDPDWEPTVRRRILAATLKQNQSFWDWFSHMQSLNSLLANTPSHFSDASLREKLEAGLDPELTRRCNANKVDKILVLRPWALEVKRHDENRRADLKRAREVTEEVFNRREDNGKRRRGNNTSNNTSNAANFAANPGAATAAAIVGTIQRLAALTDAEREQLDNNNGCRKCRRLNVYHISKNCPNGFPDAATYTGLINHPLHPPPPTMNNVPNTTGTTTTAPTAGPSSGASASRNRNQTRPVAAVGSWADETAATFPAASSALGDGSDTEDEYNENVSAPFRSPHLWWKACISGPNTTVPVTVPMLLDNGAHVVLIHTDLVTKLGLRRRLLPEPETIDVAVRSAKSLSRTTLTEWVKLSVASQDGQWTSRTVRALVAPHLCTSVILGLPFLSHNFIVTDHSARTCIDKRNKYDLLNPEAAPLPKRVKPKLKEQLEQVQADRKLMLAELKYVLRARRRLMSFDYVKPIDIVGAINQRVETLTHLTELMHHEDLLKAEFHEIFEPIPHVEELPTDVQARIKLKNAEQTIKTRTYQCPRKFREAWGTLIQKHLDAGRIRPSSSSWASPAFIIPKADPTVLPRWVNDYRQLNANTIIDSHPLPRVDDILNDCAKGKIWATIDMTDSFFQTKMHPDDVPLTAVSTPFGLYEWLVMPMGLRNAPAIHQRRVAVALREYIGKICHVYLDDIVIWSNSINEHHRNVRTILTALRAARLYCNPKKTRLYCASIDFLGHRISTNGIEADSRKVDRILSWPRPRSATDVRRFLGLVRYLASFLPNLATHTALLTRLTTAEANRSFPMWTSEHQFAFEAIKAIVVSRDCLTTIDHSDTTKKIFVTTDASDFRSGAVLSFGDTWETARPVAFDSMTFKGAELNYPVHEKEMLAIIRALRKWRADLVGSPFTIFTDHKTLENFDTQPDLSRRQARWMEFMSQFDARIVYIKGGENTVADALSRLPVNLCTSSESAVLSARSPYGFCPDDDEENSVTVNAVLPATHACPLLAAHALAETDIASTQAVTAVLSISQDPQLRTAIISGYDTDPWCKKLRSAATGMPIVQEKENLIFIGERLVIPAAGGVRESLFRLAHDTLGHFGFEKSYGSLRNSYYWPNMRKDLETAYVPSCSDCQRNKAKTSRPAGPLHPLPIPDQRGDSVAIDFIGPLPEDNGFNCILTMTDRLNADIQIVPTRTDITATDLAAIFFDRWYCENGLPLEIISDRDKLFMSKFWTALHKLTGVKLKMSSSYHPQTDGASERTNKTVNQALRYHVARNQKGWQRALPRVRFDLMNTVNKSTGFSPFQLRLGRSPRLIPPLITPVVPTTPEETRARELIDKLQLDVLEAQDNLLKAKISQAAYANLTRGPDLELDIGDRVMLSTKNRRQQYTAKGEKRVAKFMPRFDGPYTIADINHDASTVTLDLPTTAKLCPTYHTSEILPYNENDCTLFPSRELARPGSIVTENGVEEYYVDKIIDARKRGRGMQYLVRWLGYGPEEDEWLAGSELADNAALDDWLAGPR